MAKDRGLATRTPISNAIDSRLLQQLEALHQRTRIPKSRLLDEAIALLIEKHAEVLSRSNITDIEE